MSRNLAALGVVVVVGVLLWLVMAWHAPKDDLPLEPAQDGSPKPVAAPPAPASKLPEPSLAPAPEPAPIEAVANEPEPAEPLPPTPAARRLPDELIKGDQGPVAAYRSRYQSEPRDSEAPAAESTIRAAFLASDGAPDLIKSISCRQTICKIEMRWSMERMRAYIAGITRSQGGFQSPLAVSPVGPKDANGVRPIEVYLKRKPPTSPAEIEPSPAH